VDAIRRTVDSYYSRKLLEFGASPAGVDWKSAESQELRFRQLLTLCDLSIPFTVNDYGCGYGALVDYLFSAKCSFRYVGIDISEAMISRAREIHRGQQDITFSLERDHLDKADYTLASGVFNVKLTFSDVEWRPYVLRILEKMNALSQKGFAFNVLTSYSDKALMRQDLYYADPLFFFDHCRRSFSRRVALLHDYPLHEFTILVRK
jgi:SAM-dependent methyltransferase